MKKYMITWGIIAFLIFAGIGAYGWYYTKGVGPYKDYEEVVENAAKKFVELDFSYPTVEENSFRIPMEDMVEKDVLEYEEIRGEVCDTGYVVVKNNGLAFQYYPYIKCGDYETSGYEDEAK